MAKIYGALEVAQIEWFTQSPDTRPSASANIYRVIYASDVKQIQISDGTSWRVSNITIYTSGTLPAAGATNQYQIAFVTDTLQVKVSNGTAWTTIGARLDTYTSGTIPAAASNTNQMIWVSDLQQLQVSNGTTWVQVGSKAGTKNYFSQNNANPDFETNSVSPWSACTLTFSGSAPSGAPTLSATQMSIAPTATTPLSGTYSMLLTKSAANAQYQGFISGVLTIDRSDLAKVLYGSFAYEVTSAATSVDFSGGSTQSLEIWVYNVNAGTWIQPAGYRGMNQSAGSGKVTFSFQTDSTVANNQYRIAVITQQTSATAYTVEFDDFQIGPSAIVLGAVVTDWQSYTPTFQGFGSPSSIECQWRRDGDSIEIKGKFTAGTTTAVEAQMGLPSGLTSADTTKIPSIQEAGTIAIGGVTATSYYTLIEPSKTYITFGAQGASNAALTKVTGSSGFGSSTVISILARLPVQGFSSNVQMSNDTDTRVVSFVGSAGSGQVLTANTTNISATSIKDSHGSWTGSTYVVPVSGDYIFSGTLSTGVAQTPTIYKNGVAYSNAFWATSGTAATSGSSTIPNCVAGDILSLRSTQNGTVAYAYLCISRISGPSVVAATESVNASYYVSANFAASTTVPINFDTKEFDSHNAVTPSSTAWKFTAPVSGTYSISAFVYAGAVTVNYYVYKNGGASPYKMFVFQPSGQNVCGANLIKLNAGDYIDLRPDAARTITGGALNFLNTSSIQIARIGN